MPLHVGKTFQERFPTNFLFLVCYHKSDIFILLIHVEETRLDNFCKYTFKKVAAFSSRKGSRL